MGFWRLRDSSEFSRHSTIVQMCFVILLLIALIAAETTGHMGFFPHLQIRYLSFEGIMSTENIETYQIFGCLAVLHLAVFFVLVCYGFLESCLKIRFAIFVLLLKSMSMAVSFSFVYFYVCAHFLEYSNLTHFIMSIVVGLHLSFDLFLSSCLLKVFRRSTQYSENAPNDLETATNGFEMQELQSRSFMFECAEDVEWENYPILPTPKPLPSPILIPTPKALLPPKPLPTPKALLPPKPVPPPKPLRAPKPLPTPEHVPDTPVRRLLDDVHKELSTYNRNSLRRSTNGMATFGRFGLSEYQTTTL